MCWHCNNPGKSREDYLEEAVRPMIRKFGWMIQTVERGLGMPELAYSVGLTDAGLPELVVTGLAERKAGSILNYYAQQAVRSKMPEPGEALPATAAMPALEVVPLDAPTAILFTAVEMYGGDIRALQLVYEDEHGKFPWDTQFRSRTVRQPVLGTRRRG
ncbi:DUF4262 domain-containing protein [Amycolatopsis roodepoortensis]|uniref:DUF4262 domain-containing protein n=1 Tax=Amycolatopsis roodepoortensis TaxID=700274 RepID=UPI00214CEC40|nr:DUF4262 domain-containing protein [Amycolatopsis roodepoortensis]UUV32122.1 DUF4262 domain-containing protein [Amycolatopsis roodepoortensis]